MSHSLLFCLLRHLSLLNFLLLLLQFFFVQLIKSLISCLTFPFGHLFLDNSLGCFINNGLLDGGLELALLGFEIVSLFLYSFLKSLLIFQKLIKSSFLLRLVRINHRLKGTPFNFKNTTTFFHFFNLCLFLLLKSCDSFVKFFLIEGFL